MPEHLGDEKHAADGRGSGNSRTGTSAKTLKTEQSALPLEIPRDRRGDFEPQLVAKGQRRSGVLDEKLIALYGRGLTVSDIQAHLEEMYETNELKNRGGEDLFIACVDGLSGFPEAVEATKLLYLALQNIAKKCTKRIKDWRKALNQCAIFFEGRVVFHILKTELVHHRSSPKPSTILYRMRRPLCQCLSIYIFIFMRILLRAIFAYIDALWRISTRRGPET